MKSRAFVFVPLTLLAFAGGGSLAAPTEQKGGERPPADRRAVYCPPPRVLIRGRCQDAAPPGKSIGPRGGVGEGPGPAALTTNECLGLGGTVSDTTGCTTGKVCTTDGGTQCITNAS